MISNCSLSVTYKIKSDSDLSANFNYLQVVFEVFVA